MQLSKNELRYVNVPVPAGTNKGTGMFELGHCAGFSRGE